MRGIQGVVFLLHFENQFKKQRKERREREEREKTRLEQRKFKR